MLCTASFCPANVMCCTAQQIQLKQLCVSHGWNGLTHRPQPPSAAVTLIKWLHCSQSVTQYLEHILCLYSSTPFWTEHLRDSEPEMYPCELTLSRSCRVKYDQTHGINITRYARGPKTSLIQQNVIQVHYKWTVCPCSLLRTFVPLLPGYKGAQRDHSRWGGGTIYFAPRVYYSQTYLHVHPCRSAHCRQQQHRSWG